jgi:N4-gp56 family major capsid protein
MSVYGDISAGTAAYVVVQLLIRAQPYLVLEKFLDPYVIPNNKTTTAYWRRYEALPEVTVPLSEGVTPVGTNLTTTVYSATLVQWGDYVPLTDVIQDTHVDPVFSEVQDLISEQAARSIEKMRYGILNGGTNVFYAGAPTVTSRDAVVTAITLGLVRLANRALQNQNASPITKVLAAGPNYNTTPVESGYVYICHPNLEADIRGLAGFVNVKNYARPPISEHELGSVERARFIVTTMAEPFLGAGGSSTSVLNTGGKADVYPILALAQHCAGAVPLKGASAIVPMVVNPKPSVSDPLGQRGSVGWKSMQTAVILNQAFMGRCEVAASNITA